MKSLLQDYRKFEKIAKRFDKESSTLDTSAEYFLAPTTLIPLTCFARTNDVETIIFHPNTIDYVKRILYGEETGNNTKLTVLPKTNEQRAYDETAMTMAEKINHQTYGGLQSVYHICNELISNIYDHTPMDEGLSNYGYTYSQEYPTLRKLDICVLDDGLSIPGRFERNGINFENDCEAIYRAVNGFTTAKDKHVQSRGLGLRSTINLVVEGNEGSVLLISRNGCLHIKSKDNFKYYDLDNNNIFKGTLVAVRLNDYQVQNFHYLIESSEEENYIYNK